MSLVAQLVLVGGLLLAALFISVWWRMERTSSAATPGVASFRTPTPGGVTLGFLANFFDTLGIGSFATTTAWVKFRKLFGDELIPGTLNVGHALPTIAHIKFIREGRYDRRTAIGLAIGGIPGVLLAAFVVKSLPLQWLYWLVVVVVVYAATLMLRSALQPEPVAVTVKS